VAPFMGLPNGADVELQWSWSQHLLASITTVVGLALLAGAIIIARPRVLTIFARRDSRKIAPTRYDRDSLPGHPYLVAPDQPHLGVCGR
jgi:hypothetical protein